MGAGGSKNKYQLVPGTYGTFLGDFTGTITVMAIETQSDLYIARSDLLLNQTAP